MNRRDFVKALGVAGCSTLAPSFSLHAFAELCFAVLELFLSLNYLVLALLQPFLVGASGFSLIP